MITLFERATVADIARWRKAFADFGPTLKAKGVVASTVYELVDDPNDITVAHEFATLAEAQAFVASTELYQARPGAGVSHAPAVWYTKKL